MGWLHHPGSGALPTFCARRGADLQLVELVYPAGLPGNAEGGYHQSPITVVRHRPEHQTRGTDPSVFDPDARRTKKDRTRNRKYLQWVKDHPADCGAVAGSKSLGPSCQLHRRPDYPKTMGATRRFPSPCRTITAFSRIKGPGPTDGAPVHDLSCISAGSKLRGQGWANH